MLWRRRAILVSVAGTSLVCFLSLEQRMLRYYCTVAVTRVAFVVRPDTSTDGEGGVAVCAKKKLAINRVIRALKKQGRLLIAGGRFPGVPLPSRSRMEEMPRRVPRPCLLCNVRTRISYQVRFVNVCTLYSYTEC